MGGSSSRTKIVLARWLDIFCLAFFGGTATFYILWWGRPYETSLSNCRLWPLIPGFIAILAATFLVGRGRLRAFLGLKHFAFFPPMGAAGLLGFAGLMGTASASQRTCDLLGLADDMRGPLRLLSTFSFLFVAGVAAINWLIGRKKSKPEVVVEPKQNSELPQPDAAAAASVLAPVSTSFDSICRWFATDEPVETIKEDLFERTRMVDRIATRLLIEDSPSIAVIGALGAGKSTVRELTSRALETRQGHFQRTRVITVELWPFETTHGAVEGILRALIDAIAQEVNVISLRGLPEAYVEAMSAAGGAVAVLSKLQTRSKNPYDLLGKLDDIAVAIDRTYVLWVEDLERFAPALPGASRAETIEDAERLNPIRALLLGLDSLRAVNVVTATTTLETRFDLEKIARFVESIPELPEQSTGQILNVFRRGCLAQDFVDAATPQARAQLEGIGDPNAIEIRRTILGNSLQSVADALPALCPTPRTLKQSLRAVLDEWNVLRGEIDFDDLLVVTVLKIVNPNAFAFVQSQIAFLRQHVSRASSEEKNLREQQMKSFEDRLATFEKSERRGSALIICIRFLFLDAKRANAPKRPQGVAVSSPVDYWERLLTSPDLKHEERDQPVLTKLASALSDAQLCEMLEGARRETTKHFEAMIKTDQLNTLLQSSVDRHMLDIGSWAKEIPPGFMEIWGIYHSRVWSGELSEDVVVTQISKVLDECVPRNLALASAVEQYYVLGSQPVIRDENRATLKTALRSHLVARLKGRPDLLAKGLDGAHPQTLTNLVFGRDQVRAGEKDFFVGWHDLADTTLEAMRKHPKIMASQIAWLITQEAGTRDTTYVVDAPKTNALFGSFHTVIDCFKGVPLEPKVDVVRPMFAAITKLLADLKRA